MMMISMTLTKRRMTQMGWINIAIIALVGAGFGAWALYSNKKKRNKK